MEEGNLSNEVDPRKIFNSGLLRAFGHIVKEEGGMWKVVWACEPQLRKSSDLA